MVHQRGHQRDGSPHYVLLYSDDEDSGGESVALRNVGDSQPRKVEVVQVQLSPDDTLQALALRYGCTISELKRINGIHKENEIYARRSVKVPLRPYSVATESLPRQVNEAVTEETSREREIIDLIATPIVSLGNSSAGRIDNDDDDNDDEQGGLLTPEPVVSDDGFKCSGADWGLSWTQLLGFSLLLGFAGPVIYILYLAERSKQRSER